MKKFSKKLAIVLLLVVSFSFILSIKNLTAKISVEVENNLVKKVYPIGRCIGLKLYTNGVLVIGMSEISGILKQNGECTDLL